ncbi:MAG: DUF5652 family protein [Patescibacteria group bacterium]
MPPYALAASLPFADLIPPEVLLGIFILLLIVTTVLKAFALWYAARNTQPVWFAALLVLNTLGILELVYLLAFRKDKQAYVSPITITPNPKN